MQFLALQYTHQYHFAADGKENNLIYDQMCALNIAKYVLKVPRLKENEKYQTGSKL